MKILVVGGGIAGLTLAAYLRKDGHDVRLVEKARQWRTIGYVLGIFPNGLKILKDIGVADALIEKSAVLRSHVVKDADGAVLARTDFEALRETLGPIVEMERDTLHQMLRDMNRETDIRLGTTVTSLVETAEGVRAEFSDGTADSFDVVAGADGINSQIRGYVQESADKNPAGVAFWLMWMDLGEALPRDVVYYLADGKGVAVFPCQGGKAAVSFILPSKACPEAKERPEHREFLRRAYGDVGDAVPRLLEGVPGDDEIFHNDIEETNLREWHRGRVVLLGDAVHALSPLFGMGASMALEDAYVLSDELRRCGGDVQAAFRKYQERRLPRVRAISRWSWGVHRLLCMGGALYKARNVVMSRLIVPTYFWNLRKFLAQPV